MTWNEVNLFTNDFVDTFGEITINKDCMIDLRNKTRFNCATSQGELQKKWCIDDKGRRLMVKGNYGLSYQQSLNEVFASALHEKQKCSFYTPYYLTKKAVRSSVTFGLRFIVYYVNSIKTDSNQEEEKYEDLGRIVRRV